MKGIPICAACTLGIVEPIFTIMSTRTLDIPNRSGAPNATAENINMTYIRTLEAALFSINSFSLMYDAVCSRSVDILPPDFMPDIIRLIVLSIFSEPILLLMPFIALPMSFPVAISLPALTISSLR